MRRVGVVLLMGFTLTGCRRAPTAAMLGPPWFEDISDRVSLHFTHDAGALDGRFHLPQIVGSGGAFFDFDGDGWLDLYLVHNGGPQGKKNQLFHQKADGTFEDVSAGSGLDVSGYGMGVAIGDINNDGRPDVLLTEYGGIRLFLNESKGKFRDITTEAGLNNPHWATSACFFDYDRDGWLDLVVANYLDYDASRVCKHADGQPDYCAPMVFPGTVAKLFHNRQGKGFEDRTIASGLAGKPGPGLGVVVMDFDSDGWPDILVANDGRPNHLWINQKDGTFREEAVLRGIATHLMGHAQANMGLAVGDVNGDGLLDVFATHLTEETHSLWLQGPVGMFQDRTIASGVGAIRGTGFGCVLGDFNGDGHLDLVIANGRVARGKAPLDTALDPHWRPYAERNHLLMGLGEGRFRDESRITPALCEWPGVSRAILLGDVDNDGAVDLLVTTVGGRARLLRNVARKEGHWLTVRAIDPRLNRDAHGAAITVHHGEHRLVGVVQPGYSYLASHDSRVPFGLGDRDTFDAIDVRWPDGLRETFPGGKADRVILLERGKGEKGP